MSNKRVRMNKRGLLNSKALLTLFALLFVITTASQTSANTTPMITSLSLVNASTGQVIPGFETMHTGHVINLAAIPTSNFSLRANTSGTVGSVRMWLNWGNNFVDNTAPYSLLGDTGTSYTPWRPTVGTMNIEVTPYSAANGSGTAGTKIIYNLGVTNNPVTSAPTGNTTLTPISDQRMDEGQTLTVPVSAQSSNGVARLSASGLPPFARLTDNGNGTGSITFQPGAANAGTYNITVNAGVNAANPPVGDNWVMTFNDDFNGTALDRSKWFTCYFWDYDGKGCSSPGNGEEQWYVPEDVLLKDGILTLRAQRRSMPNGYQYSAGMISSHYNYAFQYGYIEGRFRVPRGQGLWPAFWMLPGPSKGWPPEIDIFEILGHQTNIAYTTLHYKLPGGGHTSTSRGTSGIDFAADFHVFAARWEPGLIVYYIDGIERFRVTQYVPAEPMYIIANLAVGGHWPGSPNSTTPFPAHLDVDYIRVWQHPGDIPTGTLGQTNARGTIVQPVSIGASDSFVLTVADTIVAPASPTPVVPVTVTPNPTIADVANFTLINADTDQPIAGFDPIPENATLNLATLPTRNLSIRANTYPVIVGSVRFGLNGNANYRMENGAPYSLTGDAPVNGNADYTAWTPAAGTYALTGTGFTAANAGGTAGATRTLNFTVVDGQTVPPTATTVPPTATQVPATIVPTRIPPTATSVPPTIAPTRIPPTVVPPTATTVPSNIADVANFTLINADTNQPIAGFDPIPVNATLNLATLPTRNLSIRANTYPVTIGSVKFGLNGNANYRMENGVPYSLTGDTMVNGVVDYAAWTPAVGTYTLTGTGFTAANGGGTAGATRTLNFTVVNGQTVPPTATQVPPTVLPTIVPVSPVAPASPITLSLINADTEQVIAGYENLPTTVLLDPASLPSRNLSLRANTTLTNVVSIRFALNGQVDFRVENSAPYSIAGDEAGNYKPWAYTAGTHTLAVSAYSQMYGNGAALASQVYNITFRESASVAVEITEPVVIEPVVPVITQPTITPLPLPAFAGMDEGALDWTYDAGWTLGVQGDADQFGLGWQAAATGQLSALTWNSPVDLRAAQYAQLMFQSSLNSATANASILVSTDLVNWQAVSIVPVSAGWTTVNVDLSMFRGQLVYVRFAWTGQGADSWLVDDVVVADVAPVIPAAPPAVELPPVEIVPVSPELPVVEATTTP